MNSRSSYAGRYLFSLELLIWIDDGQTAMRNPTTYLRAANARLSVLDITRFNVHATANDDDENVATPRSSSFLVCCFIRSSPQPPQRFVSTLSLSNITTKQLPTNSIIQNTATASPR